MKLDILIIGAGIYVCGKGTDGFGTVLPAIFQWNKETNNLGNLYCASTTTDSAKNYRKKCLELSQVFETNLVPHCFPENDDQKSKSYKDAISHMKNPSCVIIAVPDHLHYEIAKECIKADLHLMVVKPLTPTYAEGEELANAVNKANLHGVVEFHKRWDRSNLILKEKYASGQLGDLLYSLVEYSQRKSVPQKHFKSWADETSILQYLGVHYVDMMRFITEAYPQRVSATGQKNYLLKNGINTYDSIQCHVEWKTADGNTFIQTLLTNWIDPEGTSAVSDQKIKIVGTKGRVEADQKDRGLMMVSDESSTEHINPYFSMSYSAQDSSREWFGYGIDSVTTFLRDISAIAKKEVTLQRLKKIRPSFEEALISTAVIEAAHSSLKNNSKWVNVQNS